MLVVLPKKFKQCYTHKKKLKEIVNIFGLAGPRDPSVKKTFS